MKRIYQLMFVSLIIACQSPAEKAQNLVNDAISAHGCDAFQDRSFLFTFREKDYSFVPTSKGYIYTRTFIEEGKFIQDTLINSSVFSRHIDGEWSEVSEDWEGKYARSVNSVLYFFRIPCVLNDPAVIKNYMGTTTIEGAMFDLVEIRFQSDGGGEDFEDTFMYWINTETKEVDYLAYNYQTDEGGTRFRKAINKRRIDGLLVQDYINYAPAEKFPPLASLGTLYEQGQLKELSRITNEDVKSTSYNPN